MLSYVHNIMILGIVFILFRLFNCYDYLLFCIGCTMERDTTWNITWPATDVGIIAIQKCPGGSEADGS